MDNKNNCMLCGAPLAYFPEPREMVCELCGKTYLADAACEAGHFVCDACHSAKGVELIQAVCSRTGSRDPIEIAMRIMAQPGIHMHGPEHHTLVGSVLLTAYANCGGEVNLENMLKAMAHRGQQVPGGVCGFWGCCGAAVSTGIFVSLISGSTPMQTEAWSLSNQMTARALAAIAREGGPRCCKRDSFLAIREAAAFTKEHFGVEMELPEKIICSFYPMNRECRGKNCPFNKNHKPTEA